MKINILGSGTCIPSTRRGSSSYLVTLDSAKILFDCGSGATWKLENLGVNYLDIDFIFITHFHPDHTADLIPFLFATKHPIKEKRTKILTLCGPPGLSGFFDSLNNVYNGSIRPDCLQIQELEPGSLYRFEGFDIYTLKTDHTDSSIAYRIESDNKNIVYTGDTDYTETLIEFSSDSNVLIIECSLPDRLKKKGHLTPSEVARIANGAKPDKIVVTHIYPTSDDDKIIEQIKKETACESVLAEDFLEIEI